MKDQKRKGRKPSEACKRRVQRLYDHLADHAIQENWNAVWTLDDLVRITHQTDSLRSPRKTQQMHYAKRAVAEALEEEFNVRLQHVPGKGYRLFPDYSVLDEEQAHVSKKDAQRTLQRWARATSRMFRQGGVIHAMAERGDLQIGGADQKLLQEAQVAVLQLTKLDNYESINFKD